MKKQILASVLASVLATSSVYAWGFGGSSKEKPNYDYSGEKEFIQKNTKEIGGDNAKYWCFDKGNDLGCLSLEKLEALESKDLKKVVKFYEKTIPEYCYDKKFAPACNIPAIDLIKYKIVYFSKRSDDYTKIENQEFDYAKALSESKADVKMLEYGCNELKSAYICRDLRDMYKYLGDREKTKEYNDKMKNGDEKWNSVLYDYKHMRYIHGDYSSWWLLEKIK
ncbi:hypothetical protein [Campylobacter concisus]|uniref:hypothetical protein n=1 Tax=Campylobacter concisus TaxID=199 RepID=UPI000CD9C96B|nr:hypothetical protein [Campylobacter concisus]